jgi:hypothetical protein
MEVSGQLHATTAVTRYYGSAAITGQKDQWAPEPHKNKAVKKTKSLLWHYREQNPDRPACSLITIQTDMMII